MSSSGSFPWEWRSTRSMAACGSGWSPSTWTRLGIAGRGPLPFVGSFPEVNVRTYVRARGRVGVWFFSLDVDRLLPAAVARMTYSLPYYSGAADHVRAGDIVTSRVERNWPRSSEGATTAIAVQAGEVIDHTDPLVRFLTARWGLVSATRTGHLRYAPVDHPTWELHQADLLHLDDHLVTAAGLPRPDGPPQPGLGDRRERRRLANTSPVAVSETHRDQQ